MKKVFTTMKEKISIMSRAQRLGLIALGLLIPAFILALLTRPTTTPRPGSASSECVPDATLVNPCHVWIGAEVANYSAGDLLTNHESRIGRQVDSFRSYHPAYTTQALDNYDKGFVNREYNRTTNQQTGFLSTNFRFNDEAQGETWADGSGGGSSPTAKQQAVNAKIDLAADSIKSVAPAKVMISMDGEMERKISKDGSCFGNAYAGAGHEGSAAEYAAYYRNVHDRFVAKGVTNVIWSINYTGGLKWSCVVAALYPGDNYVDWITWDPYADVVKGDANDPWDAMMQPFYNYLTQNSNSSHNYLSKQWGIQEYGIWAQHDARNVIDYVPTSAQSVKFYQEAQQSIKSGEYPKVKYYAIFDGIGSGDARISYNSGNSSYQSYFSDRATLDPAEQAAYSAFVNDPAIKTGSTQTPPPAPTPPPPAPNPTPPPTTSPTAPTNVSASAPRLNQVNISWAAPSSAGAGIDHYEVVRDTVTTLPFAPTTSLTDTTVAKAGVHTYVVYAVDTVGKKSPASTRTAVTVPPAGPTGLTASYYNDWLTVGTSQTRVDQTVNFDWGSGAPIAGMPTDKFSIRWTGKIHVPVTDNYNFKVTEDDGARLWINGKLVVDSWKDQPATSHTGNISLQSGKDYDIRMDYYENSGYASAKLAWSTPTMDEQIVPATAFSPDVAPGLAGTYFNYADNTTYGRSAPKFIRNDGIINFNWGLNAPVSGLTGTNYVVEWAGKVSIPVTGDYTFTTNADDGVRLWINGKQYVEDWKDHYPKNNTTSSIHLEAGKKYDIHMSYYQNRGTASVQLLWTVPFSHVAVLVPATQFTVN